MAPTGGGTDFGVGNLQVSTDGGLIWTDANSATIAAGSLSVLVRTPINRDAHCRRDHECQRHRDDDHRGRRRRANARDQQT